MTLPMGTPEPLPRYIPEKSYLPPSLLRWAQPFDTFSRRTIPLINAKGFIPCDAAPQRAHNIPFIP